MGFNKTAKSNVKTFTKAKGGKHAHNYFKKVYKVKI